LDVEQINIERKPYNCEWDSSPIGSKHCHYDAVVTVLNQHGNAIEGPSLDKKNPPSDQDAAKVYVEWNRVEE
jgi:hypothetical protein